MEAAILDGAFADPVRDAQAAFRAILAALAEPGTRQPLPAASAPPPLPALAAAIALALCDHETPVHLAPAYRDAAPWLAFHTGAPATDDPAAAHFAFLPGLDPWPAGFALGSDAYPDRSATIIAPVRLAGRTVRLTGPGIDGARTLALDLSDAALAGLAANAALYPRGVDLLLVDPEGGALIGLPRTTEVTCTSQ